MASQTVIALKNSGSTGNTPTSLASGELAINYADGKLFYANTTGGIQYISQTIVPGVNKDVIFNDNGAFGVSSNLHFDKATSNLFSTVVSTNNVNISNLTNITTGTFTTSTTSPVVVDTASLSSYRTIKYTMQITSGTQYHSEEIMILHNGTTPRIIEYGVIYSNGSLGSFDVDLVGGNVELLFTPVNSSTTLKFIRTAISV